MLLNQNGFIERVLLEKSFGFIGAEDGEDYFFHRSALSPDLAWDEALRRRRVCFDTIESDRGPKATNVRAAD